MISAKIWMALSDGICLVSAAVNHIQSPWEFLSLLSGQKAAERSELLKDNAIHSVSSQCTRSHYIATLTHCPLPSLACALRALVFALAA